MRQRLVKTKKHDRYLFFGTFDHYMISTGARGIAQRIMLTNIRDEYGNKVAEYTWFDDIKTFLQLDLVEGDEVSFYARIVDYENEYPDMSRYGYPYYTYPRLIYPNKARKLFNPVHHINHKKDKCTIRIKATK